MAYHLRITGFRCPHCGGDVLKRIPDERAGRQDWPERHIDFRFVCGGCGWVLSTLTTAGVRWPKN